MAISRYDYLVTNVTTCTKSYVNYAWVSTIVRGVARHSNVSFYKELCGTSGGLDLVHRGHLQCGVGRRCVERCLGLCTLIGFSKNSGFGMALEKNLVKGGWNLSWPYPVTNFHV